MPEYRDYGQLIKISNRGVITEQIPNPVPQVQIEKQTTQVYKATHDGAGNRLSRMDRAFISFTYGGKYIEDFGFIATISGSAMTGNIYAEFDDNTTESDVFDGQIYWSSHYKANSISFDLATDGITEAEFDNFKAWFVPGVIRELVLMERPNRTILARVAEAPTYSLLPFGYSTTVTLAGKEYETKTTMYKGSISLHLVMDDPFWYSLTNFLCYEDQQLTTQGSVAAIQNRRYLIPSMTTDANDQPVRIVEDQDALKMILEDGIPIADTLLKPSSDDYESWSEADGNSPSDVNAILIGDNNFTIYTGESSGSSVSNKGAEDSHVANDDDPPQGAVVNLGHVAYPLLRNSNGEQVGFDFKAGDSNAHYLYYAGNAPSYPVMKFSIKPKLNSSYFIELPGNDNPSNEGEKYSKITVTCTQTKEFCFTLPSIWQGYNQVIKIFDNCVDKSLSVEDVRQLIREEIKHFAPRNYAIACINSYTTNLSNANLSSLKEAMSHFLPNQVATFTFDGENHKAEGEFYYMVKNNNGTDSQHTITEDVSDMLKSPYLCLDEKNILDENGYIQFWTETTPQYGYKLTSDYGIDNVNTYYLQNFSLKYKFKYH